MHVVRHEAVGPDRDAALAAGGRQQIPIERVVAILEEHALAPIAALGDVMRQTGHDDAGYASHSPP
jgi:hypothetical protein